MRTKLKNKKIYVVVLVCLTLILSIIYYYNNIINPKDIYGNRCQTFYSENEYTLKNGEKIEIPSNSCFVSECCSTVITFRSKHSYDELSKELQNLENYLNNKYTNMKFKINISSERTFRTYSIEYYNINKD